MDRLNQDLLGACTSYLSITDELAMACASVGMDRIVRAVHATRLERLRAARFFETSRKIWEPCIVRGVYLVRERDGPKIMVMVGDEAGMTCRALRFFSWEAAFGRFSVETVYPRAIGGGICLGRKKRLPLISPRVGDLIDALDKTDLVWYEAVVRRVDEHGITVHYVSWDEKWDACFPHGSWMVAPHHAFTPQWRSSLKKGDKVDFLSVDRKWYPAVVVGATDDTIRVVSLMELHRLRRDDPRIAPFGTHVRHRDGQRPYRKRYHLITTLDQWPAGDDLLVLPQNTVA